MMATDDDASVSATTNHQESNGDTLHDHVKSPGNDDSLHDPAAAATLSLGSTNTARQRPKHVPRHTSSDYLQVREQTKTAFQIAMTNLWEELGKLTGVAGLGFRADSLTCIPHGCSQSKLSQQELSDLQKATHFDRKELQQWYKGMSSSTSPPTR